MASAAAKIAATTPNTAESPQATGARSGPAISAQNKDNTTSIAAASPAKIGTRNGHRTALIQMGSPGDISSGLRESTGIILAILYVLGERNRGIARHAPRI